MSRVCSLITITAPALLKKCFCSIAIPSILYAAKNYDLLSTVHSGFSFFSKASVQIYMKPTLRSSSSADSAKHSIHLHQLPSSSSILLSTRPF
ncbi:hypothetical protein PGTUg99_033614 [Puccinia graminis f. sp. tritici]|uniref:Uncharacterized protein n=1 Tax=Puccinia graminis f. sp. tritici TaxID=56615 RepID=A0A5B0RYK5_PUCGR|nr:hypothetical protein PGTUg99_033614 [Puccinia graminis f. sp. tritici]